VTDSVANRAPCPCALDLGAEAGVRRTLLGGPPQTAGMRSGVVVLSPGASVGRHTTGSREELIVVLEGRGEVRVEREAAIPVGPGTAAYVPPSRQHDVVNVADRPLRYVYVVAAAEVAGGDR
jgi:quercetin dioxygenase-like cupin family protein